LLGKDGALVFIFFWVFGFGIFGFLTNVAPYIIIGKVIMPYHFSHPVNSKEYCTLLEKKGPTLIFLRSQLNFVSSCLNESSIHMFKKKLSEEVNLFIRNKHRSININSLFMK
jgi:hypothetical protein